MTDARGQLPALEPALECATMYIMSTHKLTGSAPNCRADGASDVAARCEIPSVMGRRVAVELQAFARVPVQT